jgi:hypothetical protein
VSKKAEIIALVPGASGWEIWQGQPSTGLTRRESSDVTRAGEIPNLPNLDVVLFFPVKDATVLPFRAASADESLFSDLAQMHSERMGIRTDPDAGKLIDSFVLETSADSAVLATVALRAPQPGDMPSRSPKEFDYSPRAFAFPASGIAVWKEFGHWVFGFTPNPLPTTRKTPTMPYCATSNLLSFSYRFKTSQFPPKKFTFGTPQVT